MKRIKYLIIGIIAVLLALNIIFEQKRIIPLNAAKKIEVKSATASNGAKLYDNIRLFTEVLNYVMDNYVDTTNIQDLIHGALKGMLGSLDPFTQYLPKDSYNEMQVQTKGQFGGLGIVVSMQGGLLTVISPIEGTPAWKAGIKAKDKIIKINGKSTKDLSLLGAVRKMRGKPGTKITITIFRNGVSLKDITITRAIIKIKSVVYEMKTKNIGYVRIREFSSSVDSDLRKALSILKSEGMTKLIIDLRNDPGGLLTQAYDVAGEFLPNGKLVVYTRGRTKGSETRLVVKNSGGYTTQPIVVLVNGGSASGSEIVAGALQDWSRAILVGDTTFGKGSVQSVIPLSDGSGLRLTIAKYYTPGGRMINDRGILPDIEVPLNKSVRMTVLKKITEYANIKLESKSGTAPRNVDVLDNQLQVALNILKAYSLYNGNVTLKLRHPKDAPFKRRENID